MSSAFAAAFPAYVPLSDSKMAPHTQIDEVIPDSPVISAEKQLIQTEEAYSLQGMPCHPVVMTRGLGSTLWDTTGKSYIDFNAGFSACNQGHCHPKIVNAMIHQCQKLALPSRSVHVAKYAEFCERICQLTGFDRVGAMNGGAEAVDLAIKIARAWGYKKKRIPGGSALVLTATNNYHGRTLSVLAASTDGKQRNLMEPFMPGVGPFCAGNEIRFGVISDLEQALTNKGPEVAAIMIECVQGSGGCIAASDEYMRQVRQLCDQHNVLFIADEIQGGLGRTGRLFSYESSGIKPDMIILGKSLTGGLYPMSAVVGTERAMGAMDPGQYGSTYSGNPLACAVAIAALEVIIDEGLTAKAADLGDKFEKRLRAIKSPYFDTVTGKGLFRSIYLHETHPKKKVTGAALAALCLKRGLLVTFAARRLRVCPALVISEEDMLRGADILEQALNDLGSS